VKTLDGLDVIITRPERQARRWQQQLHNLGAATQLIPVMEIVPIVSDAEHEALQTVAANLHQYQSIIFVSQNAVSEARQAFKSLPTTAQLFAIGSTTADAVRAWGEQVHAADQAMNSETLLQQQALQAEHIQESHILICRGVGGRTTLGDTLKSRGAKVEYCELYRRQSHPLAAKNLRNLLADTGNQRKLKVLSSHSGESISYLVSTMETIGAEARSLMAWPILVPGQRVAELAKQQGFKHIIPALNASDDTMTQSLLAWWNTRGEA